MDNGTMAARRWVEIYEQEGGCEASRESWLLREHFPEGWEKIEGVKFDHMYSDIPGYDQILEQVTEEVYEALRGV